MKRMKLLMVVALALTICLPVVALATPIFTTEPVISPSGDWLSVQINEDTNWGGTTHAMTGLDLYLISGDQFASPGFVNLTNGWGASASGVQANASGAPSGAFTFNVSFMDAGATGAASMYYVAYGQDANPTAYESSIFGSDFLGYGIVYLTSGGGFSWTPVTLAENGFNPAVPLPPSALLLGTGLLGLVGLGWRRRKAS